MLMRGPKPRPPYLECGTVQIKPRPFTRPHPRDPRPQLQPRIPTALEDWDEEFERQTGLIVIRELYPDRVIEVWESGRDRPRYILGASTTGSGIGVEPLVSDSLTCSPLPWHWQKEPPPPPPPPDYDLAL